jgi:hypothetical protein
MIDYSPINDMAIEYSCVDCNLYFPAPDRAEDESDSEARNSDG